MKRILSIFFKITLIVFTIGLMIQNPAYAAGALYDAQKQKSQEMFVQIDGTVSQKLQINNIYFIAGNFSEAKLNKGPKTVRRNMIILNLKDKRFAYWQIDTDGPIFDMVIVNNLLVIGGTFNTVNDKTQKNIAIFDIKTQKQLTDFTGANAYISALDQYENVVFIGGAFTQIGDFERLRLASYNTEKQAIAVWNPKLNGLINKMLVHEDRLYIVGEFTEVNGVERNYAASFLLPSGALTIWKVEATSPVYDISYENNAIVMQSHLQPGLQVSVDTLPVDKNAINPNLGSNISDVLDDVQESVDDGLKIHVDEFGFKIPTLSDVLTFAIRAFFVIAGLAALLYLLRGALAWITSGGNKDSVADARNRIQAAIIGLILVVAVLAIVWTLEQVVFNRRICIGLSCPLTLPALLEPISK